jgi:glycosyltransferase involved in cell wall biosynthesis
MRLLAFSYFFPPHNSIGAVRVGKTMKYLHAAGVDVRVVSAGDQPLQATLPLEIPEDRVTYTRWVDVNAPALLLAGGRSRIQAQGYAFRQKPGLVSRLSGWYRAVVNVPDAQIGWLPFAMRAGERLIAERRPDLLFASHSPATALIAASRLSRRHGIPWVADLRDLWMENHDYIPGGLRGVLERKLERRILESASGLVTVSEPLADTLRRKVNVPVEVVTNGFDPPDFPDTAPPVDRSAPLRLVYTGIIYPGRYDPTALFAAMRMVGDEGVDVRVSFYGRYNGRALQEMAEAAGVAGQVQVNEPVAYRESLRLQREADVLLLLTWKDPTQPGEFSGKLFEYLGAGRPVLASGWGGNVAGQLVRARGAGVVADEPEEVAAQLRRWADEKRRTGTVAPAPPQASAGYSRREQTAKLEAFLRRVAGASPNTPE